MQTCVTRDNQTKLVCLFVCLSVCLFLPDDIATTDAARITELDIQMFHDESWKPIHFGGQKVKVTMSVSVFRQYTELPLLLCT